MSTTTAKSKHVKVCIRTRPTSSFAQEIIGFGSDKKSINIHIPRDSEGGYINNQQEDWDFKFDKILHNSSQETVYDDCGNGIVKSVLEGYNGTIMAYGQTGAGKTFTMTGASENFKHRGLIPRALSHIYREIAERPQYAYTVRVSYLEIYNEQMYDLLSSLPDAEHPESPLAVIDDKTGTSLVRGLTVQIANSEEEALHLLFEGETNRSISDHQLNKTSTRSHCIYTIHIESRSRVESSEKVTYSKLNLVDLAGSERLSKTQTSGVSLKEAMYINKSLTFLEQVIIALADKKRDHIPYRQSKLTNVLRDALGGNCNTLLIANIWGEKEHIEETISTLRFATRMMCVSTTPSINVQYDPLALIKKYERDIRELKQELSMHDTLSNRSHINYEPFSESQRLELAKVVKGFVEGDLDEIEIVNLRQIRELFLQFRTSLKTLESENEDLHKVIKSLANGGTVITAYGQTGVTRGSFLNVDRNGEPKDDGRDEGVGDVEGGGFGVGLAPPSRLSQAVTSTQRSKESSKKTGGKKGGVQDKKGTALSHVLSQSNLNYDEDEEIDMDTLAANQQQQQLQSQLAPNQPSQQQQQSGGDSSGGGITSGGGAMQGGMATSSLPPLGQMNGGSVMTLITGGVKGSKGGASSGSPPNRADEFESFKRGKGYEMNKILTENKAVLKEKKRLAKEMAESMNEVKRKIDLAKDRISVKYAKPTDHQERTSSDSLIIDEEEFALLNSMKSMKQIYRSQYEQLKQIRTEIDYCSKLIDQCRNRLMSEFESWYESSFGQFVEVDKEGGTGGSSHEDVMDIGEKFDRLQMERMSHEDPDSIPYYNARKNTDRKKVQMKSKQMAPRPIGNTKL